MCEYPRCSERLLEYYEVDGRMLCERHAQVSDDSDEDADDVPLSTQFESSRAMKRVTRFIDLGASELR